MRNLRIVAYNEREFVDSANSLPLTATTWDTGDGTVISAFGPTPSKPVIELRRRTTRVSSDSHDELETDLALITSWDAPCPLPDLDSDRVLLLQYFPNTATTCVVLAGGDLILVREEPQSHQEKIEIVGSIDVGISAAAWSPDADLLCVITREGSFILMTRDLEPIQELQMLAGDLEQSSHVSVGWGRKETQFQGKRAKAMRDPTMPETVDEGSRSCFEDGLVTISWRGDGAYMAVNSVVPGHRRVIRVYSREGTLDSVSEPVDGLEGALSWRPCGNLIASVKRMGSEDAQESLEVIFFERNGLRHGHFDLRLKPEEMSGFGKHVSLAWNPDSTVLAVRFIDRIQFWTMGNYHYYLKQEVPCAESIQIMWHPESPLKFCVSNVTSVIELDFALSISRGSTINPFDYGAVAVIDGKSTKITPLKHVGVPPPMSYCDIEAEDPVLSCAWSRTCKRLALTTAKHLYLCEFEMRQAAGKGSGSDLRHSSKTEVRKVDLSRISSSEALLTQIMVQNDDSVYLLGYTRNEKRFAVARCWQLTWASAKAQTNTAIFSEVEIPRATHNLLTNSSQEIIWAQTQANTHLLSDGGMLLMNTAQTLLGTQCNSLIHLTPSGECNQVSLSSSGTLDVDGRVIAKDCTSFVLTEAHVIFTTSQHLLMFVSLADPSTAKVTEDTIEHDERHRSIERGAKIVTVIPSVYAVVLQMPRGNLETIYPRVLVLSGIRNHIQNLDYRKAFTACQNHQVDPNILHDYSPELFTSNLHKFVEELKKPSRIDEFLSKLKAEDVTATLYQDTTKIPSDSKLADGVSGEAVKAVYKSHAVVDKVNKICNALIPVLRSKSNSYLQNIITAHVCKRPPDLVAALTLVSSLRQVSSEEADLAVAHLCFLTDANRLFDTALSLYDLDLTLLVAQNAQRDPREYLPFLQSLQAQSPLRRQYTIDNHLRQYVRALTSLHSLEAHEEAEAYTVKYVLYSTAMELYKYSPQPLSRVTRLYAEYLSSTSQFSAAATFYESLGDYDSAYPLYATAHNWRESLACAGLVPLEDDKMRSLATSLATSCAEESRDYRSAASIHVDYLGDALGAAKYLCKGSYFAEAMRILILHHLEDQVSTVINFGLVEKFSEIIELVADCRAQLGAQVPRIEELRQKKAEDPLAFYGGDAEAMAADGIDIPDNVSVAATDASTTGGKSMFTRYGSNASKFGGTVASSVSRKTSKTKRKEERKRARGKKGSVYEEEYLIGSVARLIVRVNGVQEEVKRLISGLTRRGMREQAIKVNDSMKDVLSQCLHARTQVWPEPDDGNTTEENPYEVNGQGRPPGADGVFWDSQRELDQKTKTQAPEVKVWNSSSLLEG